MGLSAFVLDRKLEADESPNSATQSGTQPHSSDHEASSCFESCWGVVRCGRGE